MKPAWDTALVEVELQEWRLALEAEAGNVSRAAVRAKISRSTAKRLNTKYELAAFLIELRKKAGRPPGAGRPRNRGL